jgi:alkanesulfonate monooxygenase
MPVEFIGMLSTNYQPELRSSRGPAIDPAYLRRFARAHEDAEFDRVLIGHGSSQPDGAQVAAYAAAHTERLGFLIAHRPGLVAPTLAARTFATLDQFAAGRIAVHIVTEGSDGEQRRDGDQLAEDERYDRTDEYLDVLKQAWTSRAPFDYHGRYYQVDGFHSDVRSPQRPRIPLYFGGSSEAAYRVGGKHADVYTLWDEPLTEPAEQIASVRAAAATGRSKPPRISMSFRPIIGPTEEHAWDRAHRILQKPTANLGAIQGRRTAEGAGGREPQNADPLRLLAAASGNATALVGTPDTVVQTLLDYVDIGVTTLLIRGNDPYDAIDYGRYLLPVIRDEVARLDRQQRPAAPASAR